MNYTPNDLQNLTIEKAVLRGYKEDVVNEILDKIIEDYNFYIHENIELKDKITIQNEALMHYKNIEESLQNALIIAQQTGEDIKKNAYQKAENIIKEAEIKAGQKINHAHDEVQKITFEYQQIKKNVHIYRTKSENLLLSQLEILKEVTEES